MGEDYTVAGEVLVYRPDQGARILPPYTAAELAAIVGDDPTVELIEVPAGLNPL